MPDQRGLTKQQAADYLALSISAFDDWVRRGLVPPAIHGPEVERAMHERFAHLRHRGEWFKPGKDLLEFCGIRKFKPNPGPPDPHWDAIVEDIERSVLEKADEYVKGLDEIGASVEENEDHSRYIRRISEKYGIPIAPSLLAFIERYEHP